ncbi:MAG: hypothetical protein IJS54_04675, partial [Desulfovibrio sp.]|nr:hypothetical protein [Desulfovibrio sp.]
MQNAPLRCVTIIGALLPPDLLQRILDGDPKLPGMRPCDFGLADTERISEAINRSWQRMTALWARFAATPKDPRSTQKNLLFP